MNHITIRLGIKTKAALDIFAAKEGVRMGRALTNDQAIMRLLEIVDKEAVDQVSEIQSNREKERVKSAS
ncbi:MAG: hypothetical protein LCI00_15875 [Chloroflexi bacterium]|nr:hypothetical protein [Chloroflexota bacterium]MCC6892709.1 hypothetical protein [Anaerolineae bacterium]